MGGCDRMPLVRSRRKEQSSPLSIPRWKRSCGASEDHGSARAFEHEGHEGDTKATKESHGSSSWRSCALRVLRVSRACKARSSAAPRLRVRFHAPGNGVAGKPGAPRWHLLAFQMFLESRGDGPRAPEVSPAEGPAEWSWGTRARSRTRVPVATGSGPSRRTKRGDAERLLSKSEEERSCESCERDPQDRSSSLLEGTGFGAELFHGLNARNTKDTKVHEGHDAEP